MIRPKTLILVAALFVGAWTPLPRPPATATEIEPIAYPGFRVTIQRVESKSSGSDPAQPAPGEGLR